MLPAAAGPLCKEVLTRAAVSTPAGKDVFWYTREKQEEEAAKARLEMQAIKQREEDLMNEVGGQQPAAKVYDVQAYIYHSRLRFVGAWSQAKDTETRPKAKVGLSGHG